MQNKNSTLVLIDSHVHIHDAYNMNLFFDFVFANFSANAKKIINEKPWKAFLLLTEMKNVNFFEKIKHIETVGTKNKFTVEKTNENESLKINSDQGNTVFVISGKQIIAENNTELLALCTTGSFDEGGNLYDTIKKINKAEAIPVLPWGVGKWSGKRKETITKFIKENQKEKFYLGDNSGRPTFWNEPDLFKLGNETGHFVLPGTDALPIESQVSKTATYGFYVYDYIDENKPGESIKNIILNLKHPPKVFGSLEKIIPFFKNQITMQLNKRLNKK